LYYIDAIIINNSLISNVCDLRQEGERCENSTDQLGVNNNPYEVGKNNIMINRILGFKYENNELFSFHIWMKE